MSNDFSIKKFFIRLLVAIPLIYIAFGWYIGLNYGQKPVIFGPYPDIPVVMKDSLLGSSIEDISGSRNAALVMVMPPGEYAPDQDSVYFNVKGYFVLPDIWDFELPASRRSSGLKRSRSFSMNGDYSRAICHEYKNPKKRLGSFSVEELQRFLKETGRTADIFKLLPYLFISKLEARCPWLYSDTAFLSKAMGNTFNDNFKPYDILGLTGIFVLFIALLCRNFRLWGYYLYWVAACWFGRIGYHDANLVSNNDGWEAIGWSFWHGFILKEGRIFLMIAFSISVVGFGILGYLYLVKHLIPRMKRETEDFFKVDKDAAKRKELSIEDLEFKPLHYDINKKLIHYCPTSKYFLGLSDDKKDIAVDEKMLNHHLHVLGPTGSGKTSLVILPLARQAIEKDRGCCFIDFKGDEVFKKYVQLRAKEKGKNFYYFSIDPHERSISYNPLSSGDIQSKVDRIMTALELVYQGPAGFYSNVQSMAFIALLKEIIKDKQEINFSTIRALLANPHFLRRIDVTSQEVKGLLAAITWLGGFEAINQKGLGLAQAINNGDLVFFALKSQINTRLSEAIGRMLIIDLKFQAAFRTETDPPYFIFIDEFQNLACSHFVDVISKVRSANFCLVLSNQSRGNLCNISPAFENAIFTNTATKLIFTQEDPFDAKFWAEKTGQTTYQDKSILQVDTLDANSKGAKFDGLRTSQGNIYSARKNYIESNIFLKLPFSKSVIFLRGKLTCIANHEFLFNKKERDRLILLPFDTPQG